MSPFLLQWVHLIHRDTSDSGKTAAETTGLLIFFLSLLVLWRIGHLTNAIK